MSRSAIVLDPGAFATVQDEGRAGAAHLGVPPSGWLDAASAALANRLVGNREDAAVVECVLGGLRVRVEAAMTVAVTGAPCGVRLDGRPAAFGEPLTLAAGQVLALGSPREGLRSYVAFAGGLMVEPELGSRSTDTLSGLGPAPLTPWTVLPVGPALAPPREAAYVPPVSAGPVTLHLEPGPRADWVTEAAWDALATSAYTVQPDSNRVALRLHGAPLGRRVLDELPSEGLVTGAVQVPGSGQPLVFLNDHPTTGGYPVVAVVEREDLAACAQLRPGDTVMFRPRR